jgi:hypothetical protein
MPDLTDELSKNAVFRLLAGRYRKYRHFRWLQAIENVSPSKTTLSKHGVEKAIDGFFKSLSESPLL